MEEVASISVNFVDRSLDMLKKEGSESFPSLKVKFSLLADFHDYVVSTRKSKSDFTMLPNVN